MGISDSISGGVGKAKDAMSGHADEIEKGVDAAGDKVDDMTKGKNADKVDKAQNMAKDQIKKMNK
jgi:MT0933-like antitoxin protein